jgi:hypothetical protein
VHNHLRTQGSEGATEPGREGPGPVGLAHFGGRFGPPFPCTQRIFNPKVLEAPPFAKGRAIRIERPSTRYREREEGDLRRRIDHLEGNTNKWRRRKTLSEASP